MLKTLSFGRKLCGGVNVLRVGGSPAPGARVHMRVYVGAGDGEET